MDAGGFFYAGPGRRRDDLILDCYRLARMYARDPDEFLRKPISAIAGHVAWTGRLLATLPGDDG